MLGARPTKPFLLTAHPPVPFPSPQGAVCSRNNRNNNNDRPSRTLRRKRPRTPAVNQESDLVIPSHLDSLSPPDSLLAASVRCVARHLEGWHDREEETMEIEDIDTDDERDASRVDLSVLPSDLSQRVFEDLVRTRRLTARVTKDFLGCHLTEVNLRSYPGLTDEWLRVLCVSAPNLLAVNLSRCGALTSHGFTSLAACVELRRLDVSESPGVDDDALAAVESMSRLTHLNCAGCTNIRGTGLKYVSGLTNLRYVNVERCNALTGGLKFLGQLTELERLDAGWCNNVDSTDVCALAGLKKLKHLNLARTKVDDAGVATIGQLSALETLNLAGCRITDRACFLIGGLTALKELSLEWCRVDDGGVKRLVSLAKLEVLNLGYSSVTDAGVIHLAPLDKLRVIDLDSTQVGDDATKALEQWPDLEDVNLSDTAVGNLGLKRISKLTKLRKVQLSFSNVSDDGVMYLENSTSIRSLSLDSRMVTDEGLGYLAKLKDMEELDLFGARITDVGAKMLRHMPRLKTLELCGGGITDVGVKHIGDACAELTLLNLGQNFRITDAAVPSLLRLEKLGSLNLQYSRITNEGVSQLSRLTNLTALALKGCNRVSHAAVEELRAKMPRLSEVGLDNATASA